MIPIPTFDSQQLGAVAKVLGDTINGLTGPEIGLLLSECKIRDVSPDMTKWKRLFSAFAGWQNVKQLGNCVVMSINRAMNPMQYTTTYLINAFSGVGYSLRITHYKRAPRREPKMLRGSSGSEYRDFRFLCHG